MDVQTQEWSIVIVGADGVGKTALAIQVGVS